MQYQFDIDAERHFYFGDIFFKQFVGIFDLGNKLLGFAKSSRASSSAVTFSCVGTSCVEPSEDEPSPAPFTPSVEPEPPTPGPDPTPTPTPDDPQDGSSDDDMMWIWIIIGLGVLFLIALFMAIYYRHQSNKRAQWAAVQYANTPGNDGDLIEKDVEQQHGKGEVRSN
jgi:hypothetical protein